MTIVLSNETIKNLRSAKESAKGKIMTDAAHDNKYGAGFTVRFRGGMMRFICLHAG